MANILSRFGRIVCALAALGVVAGCGVGSKADNKQAEVRFVNLIGTGDKINVDLAGTMVASDLGYRAFSNYTTHNSNYYETKVTSATGAVLATYRLGLSQSKITVFLANGPTGSMPVQISTIDSSVTVTSGKFVLRTLSIGAGLNGLDAYVTSPTADIAAITPNSYAAGTGVYSLRTGEADAGSYRVRLAIAGTKTVVFDSTMVFAAGSDNVLLVTTAGSASIPTVFNFRESDASITPLTNNLARIRLVNAASGAGSLKGDGGGSTVLATTEFGTAGAYATLGSGPLSISLIDPAGGAVFAGVLDLSPGRDYTLIAKGGLGGVSHLLLDEDVREASASAARVRFINALTTTPVDVLEGTTSMADAVAAGQRSTAKDATAATHTYLFRQTGTTPTLAQLASEALLIGGNYGFVLTGGGEAHSVIAYRSN